MYDYLKKLPKGELHLHLNGAIPSHLIRGMLLQNNCQIPNDFNLETDLNNLERKNNLEDYLKPWKVLNMIPRSKKDLEIQVLQAAKSLTYENVKFAEIRNTVFYIAELNQISLEMALEWLLEALENAENQFDIRFGLIVTLNRSRLNLEKSLEILSSMKNLNFPKGLVGVDLAGNEECIVDNELEAFFRSAKDELGLGVTIHAGETGILENIDQAINVFKADRLGHANAVVNSLKLMDQISKRDIVIEVCPISNGFVA